MNAFEAQQYVVRLIGPQPPISDFALVETKYGFSWGPLVVERDISDLKYGLLMTVRTPYGAVEIQCTPTGRKLTATPRALNSYEKEAKA